MGMKCNLLISFKGFLVAQTVRLPAVWGTWAWENPVTSGLGVLASPQGHTEVRHY